MPPRGILGAMHDGASSPGDATLLLDRCRHGDPDAAAALLPLVYEQLRGLAASYLHRKVGLRGAHTLQPTALVHEAYLKLIRASDQTFEGREHFCAVASLAMRQILTDHARRKRAAKRGGDAVAEMLDGIEEPSGAGAIDIVALDDALTRLAALDPREARIVELRYFGGLTIEEVARHFDVSTRSIERAWRKTRAWLSRELSGDTP